MNSNIEKILVNTKWVFENYRKSDVSILDATWYMPNSDSNRFQEFLDSRIPGAQLFDIDVVSDKTSLYPHMLPSVKQFEQQIGEFGITKDKKVCIYDTNCLSAPRAYQMFKIFGHENVSILDGGLKQWKMDYPKLIESGPVITPKPERYISSFDKNLVVDFDRIVKNITNKDFTVIDARSPGRFAGTAPEPRQGLKSGCIPGSKNIFYQMMYNKDGTFKSNEEIANLFADAGIDVNSKNPLVASCGSGVTACVLIYALQLLGRDPIPLYDGSWTEYGLKTQK